MTHPAGHRVHEKSRQAGGAHAANGYDPNAEEMRANAYATSRVAQRVGKAHRSAQFRASHQKPELTVAVRWQALPEIPLHTKLFISSKTYRQVDAFYGRNMFTTVPTCGRDAPPLRRRHSNPCYDAGSGRIPKDGPLHSGPDSEP